MSNVINLRKKVDLPRNKNGDIVLACGQSWIDRNTGKPWFISEVVVDRVDDETELTIHLEDVVGKPCDSYYREEYFREWFIEAAEFHQRNRRPTLGKLKRLVLNGLDGLVVPKK